MRPTSFTFPDRPENMARADDDFELWRWLLVSDDGVPIYAVIRVSESARRAAESGRTTNDVTAAVECKGRTVIEDRILGREDSWLEYLVDPGGIVRDAQAPPGDADAGA